jgi:hypothetical protein
MRLLVMRLLVMRLLIETLDYFQIEAPSLLHAGGGEDGADGAGGPSLLADHFAQVGLVNAEFQDRGLLAVDLSHRDLIRIVDQRFADRFN